jgi:putative serine protease PepD
VRGSSFLAAVLVLAGGAAVLLALGAQESRLRADERDLAGLRQELAARPAPAVSAAGPDWTRVAEQAELSVVTIETREGLGSGWAVKRSGETTLLVTNYHVVAAAWEAGDSAVKVHHGDSVSPGSVMLVDPADDVAVVATRAAIPLLPVAGERAPLGEPVMAVGSPLGLDGTVTTGVVSSYRSIDGADFLQFSAAISPGSSGGPLLDGRGEVIGMSTEKLAGQAIEGLSFAVPVQTICTATAAC